MTKMFVVFEAELDKSKAIIRLLQQHVANADVVIATLPTESPLLSDIPQKPWHELKSELDDKAVLIPTGIISTEVVTDEAAIKRFGVVMPKESMEVADKTKLLSLAESLGIPVPKTWLNTKDITAYPVFYKEMFEAGGGIRGIAKTASNLPSNSPRPLIYQELIDSKGTYGVAFWAENGEIVTSVSHHEVYSLPESGGSAVFIKRFDDERLLKHSQTLLKALNYTGWGLVEFKYCPKRDDFVLMEINAKIWASVEFSMRNNNELARYILGTPIILEAMPEVVFLDNFLRSNDQFKNNHQHLLGKPAIIYN